MNPLYPNRDCHHNSRAPTPMEAERARVRALPSVRLLAKRFGLAPATAVLTAESFGLHTGGDR
jgi:hypothetical protein